MIHDLNSEDLPESLLSELKDIKKIEILQSCSLVLASHVVVYRANLLGNRKEFATLCMQELMRRRKLGDDFDFEAYIEEKLKTLPEFKPGKLKYSNIFNEIKKYGKVS